MIKLYGPEVSTLLINRLADLSSAENINDIIVGNPTFQGPGNNSSYKIDLGNDYYILIKANHNPPILNNDGDEDWSEINRVIIKIEKNA